VSEPGDAGKQSGPYVWTDVYMKREGRWQVVATQGSRVPP
jgi:hypothetical protein